MLKPFYDVVHLPLLFVDQLDNSVMGRRAENNDKSASSSNFYRLSWLKMI